MIILTEDGEIDHKVLGICCGETAAWQGANIARVQRFVWHVFDHIPDKVVNVGEFRDKKSEDRYIKSCLD